MLKLPVNPIRSNKKVRFWTYWNRGYVRLSIGKGQTIKMRQHCLTDEGFAQLDVTFYFDGETLEEQEISSGHDCDGPVSSGYERSCAAERLGAISTNYPGVCRPDWQADESGRLWDVLYMTVIEARTRGCSN